MKERFKEALLFWLAVTSGISSIVSLFFVIISDNAKVTIATFKRKLINSDTPTDYEVIGSVNFNTNSKSYEYILTNPEVGYFYRIEWEK